MSNRYVDGMGISLRCSNEKERKWFLEMINPKINSIIKRIERYPDRDIGDIMGDNIGIFGSITRKILVGAIHLRKIRAIEPEEGDDWFTACYAEVARMNRLISVVLFAGNWYLMGGNQSYYSDLRLVVACISERAEESGDEEAVKDALIKLLMNSDLDIEVTKAISSVHPEFDIEGLRTIADFEMACND